MLTKSIRRKPGQVLAVLAAVTSLSGLAEAQQSGLFPLQPIRRERTPCANEEPIYKLYRDQYYGYYPTRWRKFPDNWNLPSPEGPNTKEVLKKNPIEGPKGSPLEGNEGDEMQGPAGAGGKPAIPNPPPDTERSPFEMDKPDSGAAAAPGAATPGRRNPAARSNTPPPGAAASPFDTPDLAPPGDAPAAPPRTSWNRRFDESRQKDPGPLLSMSDATLPSVEEASNSSNPASGGAADAAANNSGAADPATAPAATQPAPRRGPISSLFAGLGWNWLRR